MSIPIFNSCYFRRGKNGDLEVERNKASGCCQTSNGVRSFVRSFIRSSRTLLTPRVRTTGTFAGDTNSTRSLVLPLRAAPVQVQVLLVNSKIPRAACFALRGHFFRYKSTRRSTSTGRRAFCTECNMQCTVLCVRQETLTLVPPKK